MKAYPEYKASGIDWIGEIPSHWEVMRLQYLFKFTTGATPPTKFQYFFEGENKWVTISDLKGKCILKTKTGLTDEAIKYCGMYPSTKGSLLFSFKLSVGTVAFCGEDLYTNEAIATFPISDSYYIKFWYYALPIFVPHNSEINIYGAKILNQQRINNAILAVPPLAEQKAIADYLDVTTGRIDALISEKRKQVEVIRAYRTSLITETVTRGINPDAKLRPSGIDWIGKIPSHWNVVNLKYLINEPLMYGANESPEIETNLSNPRYIRITDIDENGCLKKDTFRTLQLDKAQPYFLRYGDILFARSGATVGKTYRFTEDYPAAFAGYLIKASCGSKIDSLFLLYYTNTQCYNNWKNSIFDKSTIQNISADKYNNLPVVVPPLSEQQAIADFLDAKTEKIDELVGELIKQIDELTEYKQSVITEAVTGKVDVRDYKPSN